MIETFLTICAILVLAAAALLMLPLLRKRADAQTASINTAVAWLVLVLFGSGGLYVFWSTYDWNETHVAAETPAAQAAKLARQLASKPEEPGDVARWLALGRLYEKIGQVPLASRAYERADKLAGGTSPDAILGLADMMVSRNLQSLAGEAGRKYERVLELDPGNGKAWFFAGIASLQRGAPAQARERISHVLTLNPDPELRMLTERFIAGIDAQVASASAGAGQGESTAKAAADAPRISVRVTLAPALAAKVPADALLFVAARDPGNPGPPFAAKRLAAKFPVDVELTPADAMMAGRQISAGGTYNVVARVALGGTPTASSGDPFGQVGYHVGKDGRLSIVIDKLSP
jgi:cytochrome c-type biogenesis protein CcmH